MNESEGIAGPSIVSTRPRTLEGWENATRPAGNHREKADKSTVKWRENAKVILRWRMAVGLSSSATRCQLKSNGSHQQYQRAHRSRLKRLGLSFGCGVSKAVTDAADCFDEIRVVAKFLSQRADVDVDRPLEDHRIGAER